MKWEERISKYFHSYVIRRNKKMNDKWRERNKQNKFVVKKSIQREQTKQTISSIWSSWILMERKKIAFGERPTEDERERKRHTGVSLVGGGKSWVKVCKN